MGRYTLIWGRDSERGYYFTLVADGSSVTYSSFTFDDITLELLQAIEARFCSDYDLLFSNLTDDLDWKDWGYTPFFTKCKCSHKPKQVHLRGCPIGCGRVLRDHERFCPHCIADGSRSLYEIGIGL
jgi:hypothetical protein